MREVGPRVVLAGHEHSCQVGRIRESECRRAHLYDGGRAWSLVTAAREAALVHVRNLSAHLICGAMRQSIHKGEWCTINVSEAFKGHRIPFGPQEGCKCVHGRVFYVLQLGHAREAQPNCRSRDKRQQHRRSSARRSQLRERVLDPRSTLITAHRGSVQLSLNSQHTLLCGS